MCGKQSYTVGGLLLTAYRFLVVVSKKEVWFTSLFEGLGIHLPLACGQMIPEFPAK